MVVLVSVTVACWKAQVYGSWGGGRGSGRVYAKYRFRVLNSCKKDFNSGGGSAVGKSSFHVVTFLAVVKNLRWWKLSDWARLI